MSILQLITKLARTAEHITNIILKNHGRKHLRFFPKKFLEYQERFVVKYLINLLNTFDFEDLEFIYDIAPYVWKETSWEHSEVEVEEAYKEWWNPKFQDEVFEFIKETYLFVIEL